MGEELKLYNVFIGSTIQYHAVGRNNREVVERTRHKYRDVDPKHIQVDLVKVRGFKITLTPLEQIVSSQ